MHPTLSHTHSLSLHGVTDAAQIRTRIGASLDALKSGEPGFDFTPLEVSKWLALGPDTPLGFNSQTVPARKGAHAWANPERMAAHFDRADRSVRRGGECAAAGRGILAFSAALDFLDAGDPDATLQALSNEYPVALAVTMGGMLRDALRFHGFHGARGGSLWSPWAWAGRGSGYYARMERHADTLAIVICTLHGQRSAAARYAGRMLQAMHG